MHLTNVKFSYRVNDKKYTVNTAKTVENARVKLDISDTEDRFSAVISTKTPVEILCLEAEFDHTFPDDAKIFLNGYQSWTECREYTVNDIQKGVDHIPAPVRDKFSLAAYGDYTFTQYGREKGCLHGFSYGYIRHGIGEYDLIGSLNEHDGFTVIRTDTAQGKIIISKDCKGCEIKDTFGGLDIFFGRGEENAVFDRYFELMGIKAPSAKPVFGYTSWYRHYQDINHKKISDDLEGLKTAPVRADIFQIDDGYQCAVGDWLRVDTSKFPDSMKAAADSITDAGLIPGIWLAPFVCEEKSEIYRTKKDWLLYDENGRPVKGGSNWSGFYALDIYNQEVRDYLKNVFDVVVNEWGFKLLKLDFLYAACIIPRRDKTRGMIMHEAMELLRELAGDARILACGVPLASAFGIADYCRIGPDVSLEWNDKIYMQNLHRERPSTRNTVLCSAFRRHLSDRAFINDPDVFLLRDTDTTMTHPQKKCLAEINALCGGVLFSSDNFSEYGLWQDKELGEIEALRSARILSADINGNILIVSVEKDGRYAIRTYHI